MLAPAEIDLLARRALLEGDEEAFAALARRLAGPGLTLASRVLGDRGLAEDAVQEALVKLWRARLRFDPTLGDLGGWWRRIVVNEALSGRRRLRPAAPLDAAGDPQDPGPGPEETALDEDLQRRIEDAMVHLPPRQRAALALFHGEGATMDEIGRALGTTAKSVEGLLARGRATLKAMLAAEAPR